MRGTGRRRLICSEGYRGYSFPVKHSLLAFRGGNFSQLLYFQSPFPMLSCDDVIQKPLSVSLTPSPLFPQGRKS